MDNRDIARRTELTGHQVRPLRGGRSGRAGMSGARGRRERSQRDRAHHRHLIELASLLATAGLADMFADTFGASSHGASVLIGLGIALVAGTVVHHLWIGRAVHAPPGSAPRAAAAAVAGSGAAEAAEAGAAGTATRDTEQSLVWRLRTEIDNTPGRLAVLAGALAAAGANIHALQVHPTATAVVDEFLVETPDRVGPEQLCAAVRAVGGRDAHAAPGDVLALVDAPTRVLALALRLVHRPAALPEVLADLLDAADVAVLPAGELTGSAAGTPADTRGTADADGSHASRDGISGDEMRIHDARTGCVLVVSRPGVPFTGTELARARAMADLAPPLAGDCAGRADEASGGAAVVLRAADQEPVRP